MHNRTGPLLRGVTPVNPTAALFTYTMNLLKIAIAMALTISAALAQTLTPQGRLTAQSNTPVMTQDVASISTIYYTPYVGNTLPQPNGSGGYTNSTFSQLTLTLSSNAVNANIYDIFAYYSTGGWVVCTGGPAWSSSTSRGTGSGTTQITQVGGIWVNAQALSNCWNAATNYNFAANLGVYLGSVYMTGNGSTDMRLRPAPVANGGNALVGLFNAYNRVKFNARSVDSTNGGWSYNSTTVRSANGSTSNRISFLDGGPPSGQVPIYAQYTSGVYPSSNNGLIGVGINSTTAFTDPPAYFGSPGSYYQASPTGTASSYPVLGFNYVQALEANSSSATISYGVSENPMITLSFEF